jgi:hypothetical protein
MNKYYPRCPKCKTQEVELIEIWDAFISWHPADPYYNDGALEPGESKKVSGRCLLCEHRWTLRGVIQVEPKWFDDFDKS